MFPVYFPYEWKAGVLGMINKLISLVIHMRTKLLFQPCDGEDQMLRLFFAEECLAAGVTPAELMQAQGFDPASLALSKYSADQSRVPAGSGRASGQWALDGNTSEAQPPPTATPPTSNNVQVEQNDIKCSAFIAEKCKGSIMREFPGEYLDLSVDQLLKDAQGGVQAAKMGKTLLFDNRIRK